MRDVSFMVPRPISAANSGSDQEGGYQHHVEIVYRLSEQGATRYDARHDPRVRRYEQASGRPGTPLAKDERRRP
jgi:hypothetical protein